MKIIITTVENEKIAEKIADELLKEKLASCINIIPCKSRYWFKEKIEKSDELIIFIKTGEDLVDETMKKLKELHSYEQPVIEVIDVEKTNDGVEEWIDEVTK
jgi:periplasmic divalent cation tolerance protein